MATSPFDTDTTANAGDGSIALAERWNVGRNQNGGVLMATAARAMAAAAGQPDPFAVTGHFLAAATSGLATVRATVLKPGRTYATALGELWQEDRERVRVLGSFGDLASRLRDADVLAVEPPSLPPVEACTDLFELLTAKVGERALTKSLRNFEFRLDPDGGWGPAATPSQPVITSWVRFRDEDTITPLMLLALADGFPPTVLGHTEIGWLPTVELSVHVFGAPPPGEPWLRARLHTRNIVGGLLDEDGELWAADGRLVARFRQLAMLIPRGG